MIDADTYAVVRRKLADAETALAEARRREARFRRLFDAIDEGLAVVEMIYDDHGHIVDMVYRQTNQAYERQGGVYDVVGRSIFDVIPGVEEHWLRPYKEVARTGIAQRIENYQQDVDRWFEVYFSRVDAEGRFVAIVFQDISERKRAEVTLRKSGERQAFLLKLGDAMRAQSDAQAIIEAAARLLGEHLGASRVMFAEFDEIRGIADVFYGWFADGAKPFPSVMRLEEYEGPILDDMRTGLTVRVDNAGMPPFDRPDLVAIAELGVRALLTVPLLVGGRLVVNLSVHQHEPRTWTDEDVSLVQDVAERLWADVVRSRVATAMRESEERQAFLLELSDSLRPLADATQIQATTTRLVGAHLGIDRAMYAEVVGPPGEELGTIRGQYVRPSHLGHPSPEPFPDSFSFETFGADVMARRYSGEGLIVADVNADPLFDARARAAWAEVGVSAAIVVPLVKEGRLVAEFGVHSQTPRVWLESEVSLMREVAERTWAAAERAKAEASVRRSEERYRTLFESIDEGFCIIEMIFDEQGKAVDYVFVEVNPAFELQTDILNAVGRRMREIAPDHEEHWFKNYGDIALTGKAQRFEAPAKQLGDRWYDLNAFRVGEPGERRVAIVFNDVTQRHRDAAALRESEELLRGFGEASSDILWIRDAETLRWTYLTPAFETIYGMSREDALTGNDLRRWVELIVPEDREKALDAMRQVREGTRVGLEYRIRRPVDGTLRWLRNTDFPIHNDDGAVVAIAGIGHDVTVEKEASSRLEILFAELQHRTRNLIAVVRAIGDRTAEGSTDLADFMGQFQARLGALARINSLLSRLYSGERVTFDRMLRTELEARGFPEDDPSARIVLDGPSGVRLRSATVQTFALAIHELATNAVKYGALSNGSGRLTVTWRLRPDPHGLDHLHVEWVETGVSNMPKQGSPTEGEGYGRMLIEQALPYQLGATTTYELGWDGVRCTIDLPLR